ncbi:MAG: hypothetical protein FWE02_06325 [Defluviitaleaceae bacterium]|nr:hypothetical protein [Defluviitaleaceae bacterium]
MSEEQEKIVLPKELQREILKFFLQTSIPRIKKKKELEKQLEKEGQDKSHIKNKN